MNDDFHFSRSGTSHFGKLTTEVKTRLSEDEKADLMRAAHMVVHVGERVRARDHQDSPLRPGACAEDSCCATGGCGRKRAAAGSARGRRWASPMTAGWQNSTARRFTCLETPFARRWQQT